MATSSAASPRHDSLSDKLQTWLATCLDSPEPSAVKDALRSDARSFFQHLIQNTTVVTENGVVLTTKKPAHEETIAKFIQELEPAFCSRHSARANALHLLCGAIEGIQPAKLSSNTTKLMGAFLLGHCSPIEMENMDSAVGHDEIVRDSALVCLAALLKSRLAESEESAIVESIRTRLDLAMQGLERRCAIPETEMDEYDRSRSSGLSVLPRSRRSICFGLLRSAVEGVQAVSEHALTDHTCGETRGNIAKFVSYTATCMHGESDPRCLVQLLELLRATQVTFAPFFTPSVPSAFSARDVFEAVSPYYPVQFTPPPNDIHGITRQSLHAALMAILCEVKLGVPSGPDSMVNLTAGIFIERLCPPEDDDTTSTTSVDILEAIQDLETLLFPGTQSNCGQLDESTLRTLATALFSAHTKASFGVSGPGESGTSTKTAADECRNLVSKIAFHLESTNYEKLWNIFVLDTIRTQSSLLASSPQSNQGRASIAFIAALAACGGQRTLRSCLDVCLPFLVDIVQQEAQDEEKLAAAVYGVAAFFSSSRVAVHRASSQAIAFHPHPLRPYSSAAFQGLCTVLGIQDSVSPQSEPRGSRNVSVQIAAIRAMEAVLIASPQDQLAEGDLPRIVYFLDSIAEVIVSSLREGNAPAAESGKETACCRTLGTLLGRSLQNVEKHLDQVVQSLSVVEEDNAVHEHLQNKIFLQLQESVGAESAHKAAPRFDRMVLAFACKDSPAVSAIVVGRLTASLFDALNNSRQGIEVKCYARTLSFVFRRGGPFASKSFHELSPPSATSEDILDILGYSDDKTANVTRSGSFRPSLDAGMSMLKLPATTEQIQEVAVACQQSYELALQIRPAYEDGVTIEQLIKLLDRVSQVVPPLEDVDNIKLCVSLPLLATSLTANRRLRSGAKIQNDNGVAVKLESIAAPLAAYALSLEHNSTARSAAVTCLCEIVRACPPDKAEPLPERIISETVVPSIQDALSRISTARDSEPMNARALLRDSLFLLAALGSVSACAGLKSGAADEVVRFLVEITCVGSARLPFGSEVVDAAIGRRYNEAQVVSSSAFGTMLSAEDAGPFWKQRLVHVALKHIDFPIGGESLEVDHAGKGYPQPSLGVLNVISHIVSSTRIGALGKVALKSIARQILGGLVVAGSARVGDEDSTSVLPLVVAATIKLLCEATVMMAECVSLVVLSLARLLAKDTKQDLKEIQTEIMVLQALATVAQNYRGNKSLELCKPAVLSVLGKRLNHPSRLIRQAAAHVSNEWSVVG